MAVPAAVPAIPPGDGHVVQATGRSASGARWIAERPAHWNGTVLLWAHGYSPTLRDPQSAPDNVRALLLDRGYALVASAYATSGWAIAEAVPDQIAALDAFATRFGPPRRVIAWGESMGGLVTAALAERRAARFAGAMTVCASSAGAIGMMNMALDGAFAFTALLAPDDGIRVVRTGDDRANGSRVAAAVARAQQTPAGRARLALAAVLAGIPPWTGGDRPPAPGDRSLQQTQLAHAFAMGAFLPRADQEARAGGVFSWNTGVDYRAQLDRSGRGDLVAALYTAAGLRLSDDLARLAATPRIAADPGAVAYMADNFTPTGRVGVPVLALHTVGDGMTSPSLPGAYAETIRAAGRGDRIALAWNRRSGHCTSSGPETVAALGALERRINTGRWDVDPAGLDAAARAAGERMPSFVAYRPPPALRPCRIAAGRCAPH